MESATRSSTSANMGVFDESTKIVGRGQISENNQKSPEAQLQPTKEQQIFVKMMLSMMMMMIV